MLWLRKTLAICLLIVSLAIVPPSAASAASAATEEVIPEEVPRGPEAMAIDTILVRPIGLVATVLGSAIFVVSLPFSALGGNTPEAWDSLVVSPAEFTFNRPLGRFDR